MKMSINATSWKKRRRVPSIVISLQFVSGARQIVLNRSSITVVSSGSWWLIWLLLYLFAIDVDRIGESSVTYNANLTATGDEAFKASGEFRLKRKRADLSIGPPSSAHGRLNVTSSFE
jgi:hypothetical protein